MMMMMMMMMMNEDGDKTASCTKQPMSIIASSISIHIWFNAQSDQTGIYLLTHSPTVVNNI
jgi:hypothetical protein